MSSYVTKKTPGNTAWFTHDPIWNVHSLGAVRNAGTPRVGKNP